MKRTSLYAISKARRSLFAKNPTRCRRHGGYLAEPCARFPRYLCARLHSKLVQTFDLGFYLLFGCRPRFELVVGGYAFVNFFIFMTQVPKGGSGNPPAIVWRGFSGHGMAFYTPAFAMLYSAAHADNSLLRRANGHLTSPNATYCLECGQPVVRTR